jgi:hypothetical protein
MKDLGQVKRFLGLDFLWQTNQSKSLRRLHALRFQMLDARPAKTPLDPSLALK